MTEGPVLTRRRDPELLTPPTGGPRSAGPSHPGLRGDAENDSGTAHPSSGRTSRTVRRLRRGAYAAVAAALVMLMAGQRTLLAESAAALMHLQWIWIPVVLLADYASRAAVAHTHRRLLRAGGARISQATAVSVAYAANAVSVTLPVAGAQVGAAFTFRRFTRAGASPATTAWTLLVSGIAATSSFAVLLAVGAVATGTGRGGLLGMAGALLAALPGWALVLGLRHAAVRSRLHAVATGLILGWRRATRTHGAPPDAILRDLLDQLTALRLPARDRIPVMVLALANWLLDCLCLAAAITAVDAPVPWQGLLLAYLTAAGATALAITPGGLGTVEIALTAALVTAGLDTPHALAATLVYRLASLWLPAIGGWVTYAILSRQAPAPNNTGTSDPRLPVGARREGKAAQQPFPVAPAVRVRAP